MNLNATIFGQAISFILFVWFCLKYIWPPLIKNIEKRQKEIADGLAFAEQARKELDLARSNITDQIKKARIEAKIIIEQANQYRTQIIDIAKAEAEKERTKIITSAQDEINAERRRVSEELRKQIVILAIASAEKIIERSVDKTAINDDLVNKLITDLHEGKLNV